MDSTTMTSCKQPWPLLFICCVLIFNSMGMSFGMGAIFTDIMETFQVSRATASLAQSMCTGLMFMTGAFTGHLQQWQGPRVTVITGSVLATAGCVIAFLATGIVQVIVGIGVLTGVGLSFTCLTTFTVAATTFHDSKSLALALVSLCGACGDAVYALFYRFLLEEYLLRGTFLILAAINCQMILCGFLIGLLTPRTPGKTAVSTGPLKIAEADVAVDVAADEEGEENPGLSVDTVEACPRSEESIVESTSQPKERKCVCCIRCCHICKKTPRCQTDIFRNKPFLVFAVFGASAVSLFMQPVFFMTDVARANQLTADDGSFFLTVIFSSSLISRVAAGILYKLLQSRILLVFSVSIASGGVVCLFYAFAREYSHFVALSVFFGLNLGVVISNVAMVHLELLGPDRFSIGRGYAGTMEGIFLTVTGPYGGLMRDLTNGYETLFYVAMVHGLLVGSLLFFTSLRFLRRS